MLTAPLRVRNQCGARRAQLVKRQLTHSFATADKRSKRQDRSFGRNKIAHVVLLRSCADKLPQTCTRYAYKSRTTVLSRSRALHCLTNKALPTSHESSVPSRWTPDRCRRECAAPDIRRCVVATEAAVAGSGCVACTAPTGVLISIEIRVCARLTDPALSAVVRWGSSQSAAWVVSSRSGRLAGAQKRLVPRNAVKARGGV